MQPLGVEGPTDPRWACSQQASAHHPAEGRTEEVQQEETERVDGVGLREQTGNSHFIRKKLRPPPRQKIMRAQRPP